jgi:dihydrofolate reductase
MLINLVVAASENNVIGKNNQLLWNLPNDMAFFKNITWGMPVIMGRKTYESLGKPLKGRTNIVISNNEQFAAGHSNDDIIITSSLEKAIKAAEDTDAKESSVIGGGEIFKIAINIARRIYITRVHATFEGDTWFPDIDKNEWTLISSKSFEADAKHAYSYTFETWECILH